jgi:hypothetical protein
MSISRKAKNLILRAYTLKREIASVDEAVEKELLTSGFARYTQRPLMALTFDGRRYAENMQRNRR